MAIPVAAYQFAATLGTIIARYFDDPARDLIEDFGEKFGCRNEPWSGRTVCGLDALHTYLIENCPGTYAGNPSQCPGELLWIEMTSRIGRRDINHAKDWIDRVVLFLQGPQNEPPTPEPLNDIGAFVAANTGPLIVGLLVVALIIAARRQGG